MRKKLNRTRIAKFGIIGAAVALAATGAIAALPGANAGVTGTALSSVPPLPSGGAYLKTTALPHNKLPKGSRLATAGLPKVGQHGPAFQAPVSTGSGSTRIVNGTLANASDYPWIVGIESLFLGTDQSNQPAWFVDFCTGTVLSPTKILTAGHCTADLPYGDTEVIAGRNTLPPSFDDNGSGGFVAGVASTWTNQAFNLTALDDPNNTNVVPKDDVSVLTLKTPLPAAYTPVTLSAQNDQTPYAAGTSATIVGYGVTGSGANDPGTLRTAAVPIASDTTCGNAYPGLYDATRMTCSGTANPADPDTCGGDSGGPLLVGGNEVGITDWGQVPCGSSYGVYERISKYRSLIDADLTRAPIVNLDFTGDGHTDLMARDKSGGLWLYSGSGFAAGQFPAFDDHGQTGSGWQIYAKLFRVTNWNGDGRESIMAETPGGDLHRYDFDVQGNISGANVIGSGWGAFSDIMVTNNWNGDNKPSLMGRTRAGDLFIYNSDGHGGWSNPAGNQIGTGWGAFDTVLTPGNWTGSPQGFQSLLGRTPGGNLFLYTSNGQGGWSNGAGTLIGTGWNGFKIFQAPGDLNGDDMMDVIGVTPGGSMFLYTTNGQGKWITGAGQPIGSGWQMFNQIF